MFHRDKKKKKKELWTSKINQVNKHNTLFKLTVESIHFYHFFFFPFLFELFWKNSSYVSGVSVCIFVALYVGMFVARANKVEGTMSWCLGTNEILASIKQHLHVQIVCMRYFYNSVHWITVRELELPHVRTTKMGKVRYFHVQTVWFYISC